MTTATRYVATIEFTTDRPLTDEELEYLALAIDAQVGDPAHHDGESRRAEFSTLTLSTSVKGDGKDFVIRSIGAPVGAE